MEHILPNTVDGFFPMSKKNRENKFSNILGGSFTLWS